MHKKKKFLNYLLPIAFLSSSTLWAYRDLNFVVEGKTYNIINPQYNWGTEYGINMSLMDEPDWDPSWLLYSDHLVTGTVLDNVSMPDTGGVRTRISEPYPGDKPRISTIIQTPEGTRYHVIFEGPVFQVGGQSVLDGLNFVELKKRLPGEDWQTIADASSRPEGIPAVINMSDHILSQRVLDFIQGVFVGVTDPSSYGGSLWGKPPNLSPDVNMSSPYYQFSERATEYLILIEGDYYPLYLIKEKQKSAQGSN